MRKTKRDPADLAGGSQLEPTAQTLAPGKNSRSRRSRDNQPIGRRLGWVVAIPSVAMLALWGSGFAWLAPNALYSQGIAEGVQEVSIPAVTALASAQQERRLSLSRIGQPAGGDELKRQQDQTDATLARMQQAAAPVAENAPSREIVDRLAALNKQLAQLPAVRLRVNYGLATREEINTYYNNLLDSATALFETQARIVPDYTATQGAIAATSVFRASDLMSREGSEVADALSSGTLSPEQHLRIARLNGSYHAELDKIAPYLRPSVTDSYVKLQHDEVWQRLVRAEDLLVSRGAWSGQRAAPPVSPAEWGQITADVSQRLTELTIAQAQEVSAQAVADATAQLRLLGFALLGTLVGLIVTIVLALIYSRSIVDRALVTRLVNLRDAMANLTQKLREEIIPGLKAGKTFDTQELLPEVDKQAKDEIGQVAQGFVIVAETAIEAATSEARARAGLSTVFRNIGGRIDNNLKQAVEVLNDIQQQDYDEQFQGLIFRLDHHAIQTQRFVENLLDAGGNEPSRRWREPKPLVDVIRSGISEVPGYTRILLRSIPRVWLAPQAITEVSRIVAELTDNALQFSGLQPVDIHAEAVSKGIAVQVVDRGNGMSPEERANANVALQSVPSYETIAFQDQPRLGHFVVARRASKHPGLTVTLTASEFDGITATILIPDNLLVWQPDPDDLSESPAPQTLTAPTTDREATGRPRTGTVAKERGAVPPRTTVMAGENLLSPDDLPEKPLSAGKRSSGVAAQADRGDSRPVLPQRPHGRASLPPELRNGGSMPQYGNPAKESTVSSGLNTFSTFRDAFSGDEDQAGD